MKLMGGEISCFVLKWEANCKIYENFFYITYPTYASGFGRTSNLLFCVARSMSFVRGIGGIPWGVWWPPLTLPPEII